MANARQIKQKMLERKEAKQGLIDRYNEIYAGIGKRPAYTDGALIAWRLAKYFYACDQSDGDKPYTETGLAVALMVDGTTVHDYQSGARDHLSGRAVDSREGTDTDIDRLIARYSSRQELLPYYAYLIGADIADIDNYTGTGIPEADSANSDLVDFDSGKTVILLSVPVKKARQLVTMQREERLAKQGKVGNIFEMKAREGWQDEKVTVHKLELPQEEKTARLEAIGYKKIED